MLGILHDDTSETHFPVMLAPGPAALSHDSIVNVIKVKIKNLSITHPISFWQWGGVWQSYTEIKRFTMTGLTGLRNVCSWEIGQG